MQFVVGADKGIFWAPDAGAAAQGAQIQNATAINVEGWDIDDNGDLVEVTNTGTRGQQAFLAAIQRTGITITAKFDAQAVLAGLGVRFGVKGTITVLTGTQAPWSVHVIVANVKYKSVVNGAVSYTFEVKSDAINAAGQVVATTTYPF
ncbi:MAG: hypothetical protein K2R98_08505 [Gemmataceae bacterium]|nr:hypothetical protein [Gemmataceae bacterium]